MKDGYDLTYLSFGAGVQSTALLALSCLGQRGVPRADLAIFADTQAELPDTYRHIEWMREWAGGNGVEVVTTTAGSLQKDTLEGVGQSQCSIPAFIKTVEGTRGVMRRQCTHDYKLVPIEREVRRRMGLTRRHAKGVVRVRALIGISLDEAHRMKPSRTEWIENRYPLVEARLTRNDCLRVLDAYGIPRPPRSACVFCPFHRDHYWSWLKRKHPEQFAEAVRFDKLVRTSQPNLRGEAYLHQSLVPLDEVDLDGKSDPQLALFEIGFGNECEGMCGV
jgi:hypothetical protein